MPTQFYRNNFISQLDGWPGWGTDLVQEDQCPLESVVNLLICRVSDALELHLSSSQLEVTVPELVAESAEIERVCNKIN